jgi:hypothetical protein
MAALMSSSRLAEAAGLGSRMRGRMTTGLTVAVLLHSGLLLAAYLRPLPQKNRRSQPIRMEVLQRPKPPPPEPQKPPEPVKPPEPAKPLPPTPQPVARPLPRQLLPVDRPKDTVDPQSPALIVPPQPPAPPDAPPVPLPKGPINLFPKSLATIVGAPAAGAPIPKAPDRLLKDERLEEKKEPPFELVPEKDGGFRAETRNFIARIKKDGTLSFENRFPIGFQKGGTFSFDLTDLLSRGKNQDPYYSEKRRFADFSEQKRAELRKKWLQESTEKGMATLGDQLASIWGSSRSAALRRREIYEKWADCSDGSAGEDRMGRKGRRAIEDFIRTHLPEGSSEAYTADELSRIAGERGSLPPFDPYRSGARD